MKKHFLFLVMTSIFLIMHGAEQPTKRLVFPLPGKSIDDLWELVRKDWQTYHFVFESLPQDINYKITTFLMMLNNSHLFSNVQDQFFRKLLSSCITLCCEKKEWLLPIEIKRSCDGKYYLGYLRDYLDTFSIATFYDAKTKRAIETFSTCDIRYFLAKRNMLLIDRKVDSKTICSLYELSRNKWYDIKTGKRYLVISPSEKYMAARDKNSLYVWNIANVDTIMFHTIAIELHNNEFFIKFSSDDKHIILNSSDGYVGLLAIKDVGLKILEWHKCDDLEMHTPPFVCYSNDSEYFIFKSTDHSRSLGMKLEENKGDSVVLKKVFDIPGNVRLIMGKETILAHTNNPSRVSIMDYSGKIIHQSEPIASSLYYDIGKHICCSIKDQASKKIPVMIHVLCDEDGKGIGFEQCRVDTAEFSYRYLCNDQKTLLLATLATEGIGCFDFYGKKLLSFDVHDVHHACFHPNGRAILIQDENKNIKKKYVLYPKGADQHLKNLVHAPLSVAQYVTLEKICNEVETLRGQKNSLLALENQSELASKG